MSQVPARQAARFRRESTCPLKSAVHHPAWRLRHCSGQQVEGDADAKHHRGMTVLFGMRDVLAVPLEGFLVASERVVKCVAATRNCFIKVSQSSHRLHQDEHRSPRICL